LEGGQGTGMNFERHLVLLEKFPDIQKKRVIEAAWFLPKTYSRIQRFLEHKECLLNFVLPYTHKGLAEVPWMHEKLDGRQCGLSPPFPRL